jgi:cytochrome c556
LELVQKIVTKAAAVEPARFVAINHRDPIPGARSVGRGDLMMSRSMYLIAGVVAFAAGAVAAQSDPIAVRKALMKANGDQAKIGAAMIKGETAFDAEKAKTVFATFLDAANKMPTLFPDNSKSGGETAAAPKIWENMADFRARFAKFASDAKTAETSVRDLDTFKAAFGTIGKQDCGACHELYRLKKS